MLLLIRTTWHLTHGRLGASDMWTLENFQAGSVFVAILCQRTVSTMFLCALSLPLQQTAAKSFDLLIHTMRNLFSLTSNAIWPIMTKSRSPKSVVRVEMSALETRNACYFTLRPAFPLSDESISVSESQNSRVFILPGRQGACFCRFNRAVVW